MTSSKKETDENLALLLQLIDIGTALSSEKNHDKLLETILDAAQRITNADGGTLYIIDEDNNLAFSILRNDSLNLHLGGTSGNPVPFDPVPIYDVDGNGNYGTQAIFSVLTKKPVNIKDVYDASGFDFEGTKVFDDLNSYRSTSVLTIPMLSHEDDVIGVLQLVNAQKAGTKDIIPFSKEKQLIVQSLASQAAVALNNQNLIEGQRILLESFIKVIANAIDAKSPYTGAHCTRVPALTMMLAEAGCAADWGPFKEFDLNEEEKYELHIAGWLHDCGKVVTPPHVMDKPTKLSTIFDRIHYIKERFEILVRDVEIAYLKKEISEEEYKARIEQIDSDRAFLREVNIGGEFMEDEKIERIEAIGAQEITVAGKTKSFLNDNELENLTIRKGTLTPEEREIINDHMVVTLDMLEALPFPKHLKRVPEYAGGHHEKMDGTGYPRGLNGEEMSIPAKMMAVADVFEALTAEDRPYKPAKKLSETMEIMGRLKENNHFDPDIFNLFIKSGVWLDYAKQYLDKRLIDEVDTGALLKITPRMMQ